MSNFLMLLKFYFLGQNSARGNQRKCRICHQPGIKVDKALLISTIVFFRVSTCLELWRNPEYVRSSLILLNLINSSYKCEIVNFGYLNYVQFLERQWNFEKKLYIVTFIVSYMCIMRQSLSYTLYLIYINSFNNNKKL